MANLVIVESPSKATTIKSYLGSNYKVITSILLSLVIQILIVSAVTFVLMQQQH